MDAQQKFNIERILKEIDRLNTANKLSELRRYKAEWECLPPLMKLRPLQADFGEQVDAHIERFEHERRVEISKGIAAMHKGAEIMRSVEIVQKAQQSRKRMLNACRDMSVFSGTYHLETPPQTRNETPTKKSNDTQPKEPSAASKPTPIELSGKTLRLKQHLEEYGFFELQKVSCLSEEQRENLVKEISKKGLPYAIAMLEHLDFLKHLHPEHFKTLTKRAEAIAKWFDTSERTVRGNINILSKVSEKAKRRYTAYKYKETVKKDYEKLK